MPIRYEGGKISTYEWYDKDAREKAVEAWNTRKPMDRIVEQLEEQKNENGALAEMDWYGGMSQGFHEAIEIVKGCDSDDR